MAIDLFVHRRLLIVIIRIKEEILIRKVIMARDFSAPLSGLSTQIIARIGTFLQKGRFKGPTRCLSSHNMNFNGEAMKET
jgi:hypothetical protein